MIDIHPITLTGRIVRLIPLLPEHAHELAQIGENDEIWTYMRYGPITTEERMHNFIQSLLAGQSRGTDLPFTVQHLESGRLIGMTRYLNIETANRAVEIGGTWYGMQYQRTGVNTECKFLLLQHAFEQLDVIRVQFKADLRNERSQRAIERIGAVREGVLRDHMVLPDGTVRSSVFYSILAREWPETQIHMQQLMKRYSPS